MPKRIQRKRTKGWKMPEGAIYVGRPSLWANEFRIGRDGTRQECVTRYRKKIEGNIWTFPTKRTIQKQLGGKDLVCWCPLDKPCHADVLLELANPTATLRSRTRRAGEVVNKRSTM